MKNVLRRNCLITFLALIVISAAGHTAFAAETACGDRGGDPEITFPDNMLVQNGGPILDVKRPPEAGMHAAVGDGKTDDTDALRDAYDVVKKIFVAKGGFDRENYFIYLPAGTYLVKDTIIYRGENVGTPGKWTGKFDVDGVRFIGQGRSKTTIRLADNCPGFQDATAPKILLAYQYVDTVFNNAPGGNELRDMTINTGTGNPGAVAVFFQGANQTDMQHVTIQSGDGAGVCGIWFKIGSAQGYYNDITVRGFDLGINDGVHGEGDINFEYLTLTGQRTAGILQTGDGISLRKILSDQQNPDVPAISVDKSGTMTVVLDSQFRSSASKKAAIEMSGDVTTADAAEVLLARNVATSGYAAGINVAQQSVADAGTIKEYLSATAKTLSPDQPTHTLDLPIEDTPMMPQLAQADWAIVDDVSQLQTALKSGKPGIMFRKHEFKLTENLEVPATVKVIDGWGGGIKAKALIVSEASADPLFLIDGGFPVHVEAQRNIVQHCAGGGISNPKALPVTFFLENVNDNTTGNNFCQPGQKVFARSIDIEYRNVEQIVCNGGAMWLFGYKTEYGKSAPLVCRNGGSLEILGGYTNATSLATPDKLKPLILNDNSNVSATLFTNLRSWPNAIEEMRGDQKFTAADSDFPRRGKQYGKQYIIPLYVGIQPPAKQ